MEDGIVIMKRLICETIGNWNGKILELASKKKDEKAKKPVISVESVPDSEGHLTEEAAPETQVEDLSPVSLDATEAINAVLSQESSVEAVEVSDSEVFGETANVEEIVVVHGSPKWSPSEQQGSEETKKKKKKTILSQLLPTAPAVNPIPNMLGTVEHHLLPLGLVEIAQLWMIIS